MTIKNLFNKIKEMKIHHVWMFYYAILLHLWFGISLLAFKTPSQTVSINTLYQIFPNPELLGVIFIVIAILAFFSMAVTKSALRFGLLIAPQQAALFISAIGSLYTVFFKHYGIPDLRTIGVTDPKVLAYLLPIVKRITDPHILLTSQAPTILAAACHMGAVIWIYRKIALE